MKFIFLVILVIAPLVLLRAVRARQFQYGIAESKSATRGATANSIGNLIGPWRAFGSIAVIQNKKQEPAGQPIPAGPA